MTTKQQCQRTTRCRTLSRECSCSTPVPRSWLASILYGESRETEYTIYAATEDDYNEGYVWLLCPASCTSRMFIELRYEEKNAPFDVYKTYCEARIIDQNFLDRYERPERITDPIQAPPRTLVISQWYRDNLGGLHTQQGYLIRVRKLRFPGWRALRAASHHPDIAVRVGTKLGMLGVWLGFVALAEALIDKLTGNHPEGVPSSEVPFVVLLVIVSVFSAVLCWMPCRAPKRPEPSSETSESSPQCTSDRRESTERLSS